MLYFSDILNNRIGLNTLRRKTLKNDRHTFFHW